MDEDIRQKKREQKINEWRILIDQFHHSNLSLDEWCKLNNVGKSSYYKYLRLIRGELLSVPKNIENTVQFFPLKPSLSNNEPIVITKENLRIESDQTCHLDTIMSMIKVLL